MDACLHWWLARMSDPRLGGSMVFLLPDRLDPNKSVSPTNMRINAYE